MWLHIDTLSMTDWWHFVFLYLATFIYAVQTGRTMILFMNVTGTSAAVASTPTPPRLGTFDIKVKSNKNMKAV